MMRDDVREELERLRTENGGVLTAELVVAAAQKEDNPLHSSGSFTWNVQEAAWERWCEQARALIRSYTILIRETIQQTLSYQVVAKVPEYSPLPGQTESGYARTDELLSGSNREDFLLAECNRWCGHCHRMTGYLAAAGLTPEAQMIESMMDRVRSALTTQQKCVSA